jgi:hypothetical protein
MRSDEWPKIGNGKWERWGDTVKFRRTKEQVDEELRASVELRWQLDGDEIHQLLLDLARAEIYARTMSKDIDGGFEREYVIEVAHATKPVNLMIYYWDPNKPGYVVVKAVTLDDVIALGRVVRPPAWTVEDVLAQWPGRSSNDQRGQTWREGYW